MKFFLVIFCCFIALDLFAQSSVAIEADLLKSFKKIDTWRDKESADTTGNLILPEQLGNANEFFAEKLQAYAAKYPVTITYPFSLLVKDDLDISTSTDGLFRIYSWDTWTGGTMHFFENVMQYKAGAVTKAIIDTPKGDGDNRPNYYKMYTFKANSKSYYLAVYLFIGSTIDLQEGVRIFTIENGRLKDAKLIKTHSALHSDLSYSVHSNSYDRPKINFDNATNTIYLPLIDGNNNFTGRFILYKFTGQYFEMVKN
jgi:hypothetical protein